MKSIGVIYIALVLMAILIFGCMNKESNNQCACTIKEIVDTKKGKEQKNSNQTWEAQAGAELEALVKKVVDAKIDISGSYSNSNSKIEEVYSEISIANPQITQKANLYRTVSCAYYEIVCQDKSLNDKDKSAKLKEVIAGFEKNIHNILNEEKLEKTEIKQDVIINKPETTLNSKAQNQNNQQASGVFDENLKDNDNNRTQPNTQKNLKSFELTIIVNSGDKILINGQPATFNIGTSSTIKKVEIIEGERYEIIIGNCDPIIINKVSKNQKITRCS